MRLLLLLPLFALVGPRVSAQIQVEEAAFAKSLRPFVTDVALRPQKLVVPGSETAGFSTCSKSLPGALSSRIRLDSTVVAEVVFYQGPDLELASVWQNRLYDALRKTYPGLPTETAASIRQLDQTLWVERTAVSVLYRPHPVHGFQALVRITASH